MITETTQTKTYFVKAPQVQNLSDAICALKIANWLKKQDAEAAILIITNRNELFKNCGFTVVHLKNQPVLNIALQILVPVSSAETITPFLSKEAPNLLLFEYGYGSKCEENTPGTTSKSFGLEEGDLGIFIHDEFKNVKPDYARFFNKLSKPLREKILKLNISENAWNEEWNLYCGHSESKQALADYVEAVARLNEDNSKNLLIVFPETASLDLIVYFESFAYGSLESHYFNGTKFQDEDYKRVHTSAGKRIFVIYGNLPPKDIDQILIHAEKEMIVTSDDSFSKAISLENKIFIFTESEQKQTFAKGLKEHHKQVSVLDYIDERFATPKANDMHEFFSAVNREDFFKSTLSLIQSKNCQTKLLQLFTEALNNKPEPLNK